MSVLYDSLNLTYEDSPREADVIVMLGGGNEDRITKAAELYHDGYADYVMITPLSDNPLHYQSVEDAVRHGISERQLIHEYDATSTYTNATRTADKMREHGFTSALIVTSDYHMKRSKLIFDRVNDGSFEFTYIPALSTEGERWIERDYALRIWASEFVKMWGYRFGLYKFVDIDVELYQP
ncbi:YdcF family protein [Aliicoccus persicus]|uniref:DUF218 domain-containing protein n=1 Tax=Aliicoccus persicus TaxID=930138 RepID=A0A662Z6J4_9STAP|nr:YdcF family protein [Aliicoccus persicus]SEW10732.1 DUF218 domain-containing protein [Aliicoccus persicus]